jgi:GT2 family glycosyltransferase
MTHVPLSAIIVNWNGRRYLPACLDALLPQLPPGAEVLLVDNGSTDGSAALVRERYPATRLVGLRENLGFAGGVNAGLRAARGELLLLLNNDAFAEPGFAAALIEALDVYPEAGAASAVLTFEHQPDLIASAGIRVRRDGLALDLWAGRPVAELPAEPQPIMGPSGGAALYRRALLEDVGLMEPGYFNYLEDVDLAWRALLRGWRSVVVPRARARHVYSATAGQGSSFKQRLLGRNRVRTIVRCVPGPLLRGCLPAILSYDLLAATYGLAARQPAMLAGRLAALAGLPELLRQRRAIQARRRVSIDQIARWMEPAGWPWEVLREQRRLDAILAERGEIGD